jgi:GT2 family glycosyltransferase
MKAVRKKPELSIIIVNFNVRELLLDCLRSVVSTSNGGDHEIIVVDNASGDGSVSALGEAFPDVRLIANNENVGFARANNQGYEISRGEFLLLLNPDTVVKPGAIQAVLEFMKETPDAGLAACRLVNPDGTLQDSIRIFPSVANNLLKAVFLDRLLYGHYRRSTYYRRRPHRIDYPTGAFMMVRREALGEMPLLNPDFFMYAEEKDLALRLRGEGWNAYFVPDGEVIHYGGKSTGCMPVEMFLELQRSQVKYYRRHYSGLYSWALSLSWAAVLFSNLLASFPLMPFRAGQGRLRLFAKALQEYPAALKYLLRKTS